MVQHGKKLKVSLVSTLFVLGLMAGPVQADHDHHNDNLLAPLATILVLGSLINLNKDYKYSKPRYAYSRHHRHYGHRHNHRARYYGPRSYSYGGYAKKSRKIFRH